MRPFREDIDITAEVHVVECRGGRQLTIAGYAGDHITKCIEHGRIYEAQLLDFIYDRYGTGGVYVDFGAFIGTHTLYFALVCEADLVISVESSPHSYTLLTHNLQTNRAGNVEAYNIGAGDRSHRCDLHIESHNLGGCGLKEPTGLGDIPVIPSGLLITAPPKLVKIDAEAGTLPILRGCVDVLREHRPVVMIEEGSDDKAAISSILTGLGYSAVTEMYGGAKHSTLVYENGGAA